MAPLKPHWPQPSHPDIQEVIINEAEFTSKSLSKVSLPPFAVYAKMSFPPCSVTSEPTYATVQMGNGKHLMLNSDLLYINHSCDPSLVKLPQTQIYHHPPVKTAVIFDTSNFNILVGHKSLEPGDELTFFYPSTEWEMAQPFKCLCNTPQCRGTIAGAKQMNDSQLEGYWLNQHIRDARESMTGAASKNGLGRTGPTSRELSGEMGGDTVAA